MIRQMAQSLETDRWLAGSEYSLADAAAVPYMVRAQALKLDALWKDIPDVSTWLDAAIDRAEKLDLSDPWGSTSFAELVHRHARDEAAAISRLLSELTT